jgi:hypothetical protein
VIEQNIVRDGTRELDGLASDVTVRQLDIRDHAVSPIKPSFSIA